MSAGLKYCSAHVSIGISVWLMYGTELLPLICDQLWFSITMTKTVRIPWLRATVTYTGDEVPTLPTASQALLVSVCAPTERAPVSQLTINDEEIPLPISMPSA